jgi:hypothetical protein
VVADVLLLWNWLVFPQGVLGFPGELKTGDILLWQQFPKQKQTKKKPCG